MHVVRLDELPLSVIAREFTGDDHGGTGICVLFVEAPPGSGPSLHKHPYDEVFVVQEGVALFAAGGEQREVHAGEIVVVPAETPHGFKSAADDTLRVVSVHPSPTVQQTNL